MKTKKQTSIYGDCEGPLGFPMKSEVAKAVEDIIAKLSDDCKEMIEDGPCRMVKVVDKLELREGERDDISLITTDSVDRDQEVMLPGGGDFSQLRKAGLPVTWAHKYDMLPVGRGKWIKRVKEKDMDGWVARTHYIDKPEDWGSEWFPDAVWHYIKSGALRGKSIGFIPLEMRNPAPNDIKDRPEYANVDRIIVKWLALEWAVAPIQCNPDALVQATAKAAKDGIIIPDLLLDSLDVVIPSEIDSDVDIESLLPTPKIVTRQMIRKELNKTVSKILADVPTLVKDSIDKVRGKV